MASLEKTVEKQQTYLEELIKKYILRKKESVDNPHQLKFEFFEELLNDLVETSEASEEDKQQEEEQKPEPKPKTKSSKAKKKGGRLEGYPPTSREVVNLIDIPEDEKKLIQSMASRYVLSDMKRSSVTTYCQAGLLSG